MHVNAQDSFLPSLNTNFTTDQRSHKLTLANMNPGRQKQQ